MVKKPDDLQDIQIGGQQPLIPPSKPEVYFIKYKAQKGAGKNHIIGFSYIFPWVIFKILVEKNNYFKILKYQSPFTLIFQLKNKQIY